MNKSKIKRKNKFRAKEDLELFVLSLPVLIKTLIFAYLPMFGIIIAFKNLNYSQGIFKSPWVGFKNFEFFFKSDSAWRVTRNTIVMNLVFIVTTLAMGILFAVLLYKLTRSRRLAKTYQVIMFFPYFLSWVVVAFLLNTLIGPNGSITHMAKAIGFSGNFYLEASFWPFILTIVNMWKSAGYNCLLYYSVLMGVDESLYEAAAIDGASEPQTIRYIQIPALIPMVILNVLMAIGNIFRGDFGMFYFLPGTANSFTLETTDVIDTFAYRAMKDQANFSLSSAVGVYQSVVGFILILFSNWLVKKYDPDRSLF